MDIVRCFAVSRLFSMLGHEVINSRLNYILEHAVGSKSDALRALLDCTKSVLLGSSALDVILYGTSSITRHELRIAIPHYARERFTAFFEDIGFSTDQSPSFYTPPSVVAVYDYDSIQKHGKKVTLINSPTNSVMPVVLAHRSSTDCIFVASGGLFIGYPKLFNSQITLLPLSHPRTSTIREFCNREYEVQTRNYWSLPCGRKCPKVWHRMDDALAVTWHNGVVPLQVTDGQNMHWRLSSHCANSSCWSNIFKDPDPYSGPCSDDSVERRITKSESRNVSDFKEQLLTRLRLMDKSQAGLPCVKGLLFGAAMMHPYAVPLYLDKGRVSIATINDLNVRPFVRERGMEPDNIINCSITRKTIVMSNCAFTVIREHDHVLDTIPSCYSVGPFYRDRRQYRPLTPPRGNMLAIMHDLSRGHAPRDILTKEFQKIAERIIQADENNDLFDGIMRRCRNT
ncbi:hypothetical protein C8R48DRAFT_774703 [Suillus tomentosus]|nr:hypothetical protein C8R48DRAFT_774703 [Suillus tomentosus]